MKFKEIQPSQQLVEREPIGGLFGAFFWLAGGVTLCVPPSTTKPSELSKEDASQDAASGQGRKRSIHSVTNLNMKTK